MSLNRAQTAKPEAEVEVQAPPFAVDLDSLGEPDTTASVNLNPPPVANLAVVPKPTSGFEQEMADEGFEGLELDRFSFPQIKLDDGQFLAGDEESDEMGKEFDCVILASKAKWVLHNTKCDDKDKETFFTYDKLTDANTGELLADVIADWKDAGWGHSFSQYLEAQSLVMSGTLEGTVAILSIPPTSRTGLSGKIRRAQMQLGIQSPKDMLITCTVGKKLTNKGGKTYNPWIFSVTRELTAEEKSQV